MASCRCGWIFRDEDGLLNKGRVWLQADDIDVKPWLDAGCRTISPLKSARFSLEGWMTIEKVMWPAATYG
ncbi:hypothetical protein LNO89_19470 [Klebsiella pneumoniae subsp. pneumoniae]|nr:hypothetical protein [Klebsiella pneumoniae subsp. pneumoniae]